MAKFKVGDKVFCKEYGNGTIKEIVTTVMPEIPYYVVFEIGKEFYLSEDRLSLVNVREFIVIHRSGNVMTAEHRVNREVIKSAKATCALSDTFDFDAGAKLAFDRLMGREEPKPAPAPEPPKYYTGKVVMTACQFQDREPHIGRLFEFKDGKYVGEEVLGFLFFAEPYKSFNDIAKNHSTSTWIEVKE